MPEWARWESLQVRDLMKDLSAPAALVTEGASVEEVLRIMVEEPRTRHVYVVDAGKRLIGAIRMNAVIGYLFPYAGMRINTTEWVLGGLPLLSRVKITDLMDDRPRFVTPDTLLTEMAEILMRDKINELPIVDADRRVIGQLNVYDIIRFYLEHRPSGSPLPGGSS